MQKKDNLQIVMVSIDELRFSEYNPRKASRKQYDDLKKSIERFGFVDPLVVNSAENRKNIVIGGHFRLKIAKDMGFKTVPVVYVDIPDIEKEKELNLRLNKNTGEWDWDLVFNFDEDFLRDVGFDVKELQKKITPPEAKFYDWEEDAKPVYKPLTFTFTLEQYEWILAELGLKRNTNVYPGEVIIDAIKRSKDL